jgi:hypothetical protein
MYDQTPCGRSITPEGVPAYEFTECSRPFLCWRSNKLAWEKSQRSSVKKACGFSLVESLRRENHHRLPIQAVHFLRAFLSCQYSPIKSLARASHFSSRRPPLVVDGMSGTPDCITLRGGLLTAASVSIRSSKLRELPRSFWPWRGKSAVQAGRWRRMRRRLPPYSLKR